MPPCAKRVTTRPPRAAAHRHRSKLQHDQCALEDILVHLGEAQERHGVQHFGQQDGTQNRADEGAAPAARLVPPSTTAVMLDSV